MNNQSEPTSFLPTTTTTSGCGKSETLTLTKLGANTRLLIRPMQQEDVDAAVRCFHEDYDNFDCPLTVQLFHQHQPRSFWVAQEVPSNRLVGVCACPLVGGGDDEPKTGFFGLYGILREWRGAGLGSILFQKCSDQAQRDGAQNLGLFAVPSMRDKYMAKGGFHCREGVSMINLVGEIDWEKFDDFQVLESSTWTSDLAVVPLDGQLLDQVIEYDSTIHRGSRRDLLTRMFELSGYFTLVALHRGQVCGKSSRVQR